MRRLLLSLLALSLPLVALLGSERQAPHRKGGESGPIVVELFTSQGCSSCPPADRLLSSFDDADSVLPLAFHVDYWNRLGWRDPFSAARWSERQRRYSRTLRVGRVYTPQLVIAGGADCIGSDEDCIRRALREASRPASAEVTLRVEMRGDSLVVSADVAVAETADGERFDLFVALTESDLETRVVRGENARRTLRNDHVVRRLDWVGSLRPDEEESFEHRLLLDPGWEPANLSVVAFVQDSHRLLILGAAGEALHGGRS